jgi:hypothetical protein
MFSDKMSRDEIMSRAEAMQAQASQPMFDPRDLPTGKLISGGFSRGLEGLKGTALDLIPAFAGSIFGKNDYAKEQLKEYQDRMGAAEAENPTAYKSYKDIQGAGDILPFAAETIGEVGPDILGFLTGAGAGTSIGKRLAMSGAKKALETSLPARVAEKGLTAEAAAALEARALQKAASTGANVGQIVGVGGASAGLNIPDTFNQIYQDTGKLEPGIAITIGSLVSALDTFLPARMLAQLGPSGKARIAAEMLQKSTVVPTTFKKAFAGEVLKTASGESLTEGGQQALQILASQIAGDKDPFFSQKNIDEIITSSLKGFIGGGVYGAPGAGIEAGRIKSERNAQIAQREAQQTTQETKQNLQLGYAPFTPVVFPDGSVANTQEELDAYRAQQFQQQYAPQPAGNQMPLQLGMSATPTMPVTPQGEAYPNIQALRAAQEQAAAEAEQRAFQERTAPQQVEQQTREMFPDELGLAQSQQRVGALPSQEAAAEPAPAEFGTVLDASVLQRTGLKPQSGFFKQLLNKDMSNPEDQAAVRAVLVQIRTNPNLSESTKQAIEGVAMQAFGALAKQQEMFGPRGGILKGADVGKRISRFVSEPTGTSVPTAVEPTAISETAEGTVPPEQGGMGSGVGATIEPTVREEVQPDTLAFDAQEGLNELNRLDAKLKKAEKQLLKDENLETGNPKIQAAKDNLAKVKVEVGQRKAELYKQFDEWTATREQRQGVPTEEAPVQEDALAVATRVAALSDEEILSNMAQSKTLLNAVIDELGIEIPGHTKNRNDKNALVTKKYYIQEHLKGLQEETPTQEGPTQEEQDALQAELDAELGQENAPVVEGNAPAKKRTAKRVSEGTDEVAAPAVAKPIAKATGSKKSKAPSPAKTTETVDVDKLLEEADEIPIEIPKKAKFDVSGGYMGFAKKDIENIDDSIAVTDLLRGPTLTPIAKAAKTYFGKMPRLVDNLLNMAFDIAYKTPQFKREDESAEEAQFFKGMNGAKANEAFKWVQNNLSAGTNNTLRDFIRRFEIARDTTNDRQLIQLIMDGVSGTKENYDDETVKSYIRAQEADTKTRKLLGDAVSRLAHGLHPIIISALQAGDLQTALRLLSASSDTFVSTTAAKLAGVSPNTKVVIEEDLVDENGKHVPGYFNPQTNTIHLDSVTGMNSHVLLHESGHSAMSHELDNPNSVLARQLQQILDKVKDSLGTAYGASDVHEFASEALANKEFRAKLQSIYPDGGNISAWDKFTRAVVNFFRRLVGKESRPLTSAYDEVDRILSAILSPAPDSRNAGVLYAQAANKSAQVFSFTDRMINAVPFLGENQKDALSGGIAVGSEAARSALFSVLPMHALGEVAEKVFPGLGMKFNRLINERAGYENKLNNGIDAAVREAKNAIQAKPQQQDAFNRIVNDSTMAEVDPTKPRETYKKDPDALKAWDDLNGRYNKLDKVWQDLYVTMRNANKKMYDEVKAAIEARIDETDLDGKTKVMVKQDIMKKLAEQGMIDPYFALGREGKYWLASDYTDKNGQKQFTVEAFKSPRERSRRQEELKALDPNARVDVYANADQINYRNAPSGSFVNSVLKIMETNGVPEQAIDETMRLFITTLPETAFAKSFQKRKGRAGALTDTIGVFERKMRGTAHQVSNMMYNPKLTGVVDSMDMKTKEAAQSGKGNDLEIRYLNEFKKHLSYVKNPTKNDIGSILASGAFFYTLGFNISSALVNMANVPMIVAPYLKGKYSDANVAGAIGNASKVFLGSGRKAAMPVIGADGRTTMMDVMPSISNYAPDSVEGKKYATLIRIADEQGQLNRSQLYEIISGDTRTGPLAKINAMAGWAFHHGERMNREVTMLAAYDLELARLKKQGITGEAAEIQAANNAIYTGELTNGGISAAAAPRIAQSSIGKLLFMYKRYGVSMYYMMFKTAKEALKNADPAVRKAAWQQLGGIVGMSALMAGVQGVPMFGLASMVYALFCDDDDDDLDTVTRKGLGEFLYKGPIEYFTNLAVASRISMSDLIIRDTKGGSNAGTFSQQLLTAMGGPAVGVTDRIQRGYSKIAEGHFERGLEDILPAFAANMLKAGRYVTEGTQTLRGDAITGDVSAWNAGAQFFGFAPADYTRQLEENSRLKGVDKYTNQTGTKLRQKWNLARTVGDAEGMSDARDELLKLGAKHPGLGLNAGTINEALQDSADAYNRATKEMVHGVRFSKKMAKELKADSAEYDR